VGLILAMQKHIKTMNAVELKAVQSRNKPLKCFLWQRRSYIRKGLEAYFTVLIELVWGKEDYGSIFKQYRNGNGVYGAKRHLNTGIEKTLLILPLSGGNCCDSTQSKKIWQQVHRHIL
jgi:hypothetical protein